MSAQLEEIILKELEDELVSVFDCTRDWEAWQVGTMREADFQPIQDRLVPIAHGIAAAVRSALSPSTELPARPKWRGMNVEYGYPRADAEAHFDALESLLRAANAEAGRLKGENDRLRRYANLCPEHESDMLRGHMPSANCFRCTLSLCTTKRYQAESALATAHASSVQQGRKECANLAFAPDYPRAPQGSVQQAFNAGLSEYHRRILALGPVSPASDPRREQMEIDATFMCGMCAKGLPVEKVDGRFMHNHTLKLECRASPLRAHFERQAVLALPEAAK